MLSRWVGLALSMSWAACSPETAAPSHARCGDGQRAADEACDDGNQRSGDGCRSDCRGLEVCGDGLHDLGEHCDDGNTLAHDGCDPGCGVARCGDGTVNGAEECDDGNAVDGDRCDANCRATRCGNARVTAGEACDDGNLVSGDGCDTNCTLTVCGNGIATAGEVCDDGNAKRGDGCDPNCTPSACGNGMRYEELEDCDDGNLVSGDGCDANCTVTACGNGVITPGEQCDDGNLVSGDGCDANCRPTACGNAIPTAGEQCDDGNQQSGDGCDANCTTTGCGNGIVTTGEQCDDGNRQSGDGCDANCTATGCGNGIVTTGEQCDDGDRQSGDGCRGDCDKIERCGDGVTDAGEVCDDGDTESGDGCRGDCRKIERCGDSALDVGEVCDDGNTGSGDGCRGDCDKLESCGDRALDAGEACDDGNTDSGDGCRGDCASTEPCGDHHRDTREACDDGNTDSGDGCRGDCMKVERCGDDALDMGEACDDGNTDSGDGCRGDCLGEERCGDDLRDAREACDDGNTDSGDGCRGDCAKVERCGDRTLDAGEVCDDGNTDGGDGCRGDCRGEEACGDGLVDIGEVCDDGDEADGGGCRADCQKAERCGDGWLDAGEVCDDGNEEPFDGCRSDCRGVEVCGDGIRDPGELCLAAIPYLEATRWASIDLDADGDADLVTAARPGPDEPMVLRIWWATPTGLTQGPDVVPTVGPVEVYRLFAGDLDGDPWMDVVASTGYSHFVFGGIQGGFDPAPRQRIDTDELSIPRAVVDLDGDGILDLVSRIEGGLELRSNLGDGTFGAPSLVVAGDYELVTTTTGFGDGHVDLVVEDGDSMRVLVGGGAGTFVADRSTPTPDGLSMVVVGHGDVDEDGRPDLLVQQGLQRLCTLWRAQPDGTFEVYDPFAVFDVVVFDGRIGDFDGDGHVDVIASTSGVGGALAGKVGILFGGHGDGTFDMTLSNVHPWLGTPIHLDDDGALDMVAPVATGLGLLYGGGDGNFGMHTRTPVPPPARAGPMDFVDMDDDDKEDLVIGGEGYVLVFPVAVGGVLGPMQVYSASSGSAFAVADFDHDRIADLVLAGSAPEVILRYWNGEVKDAPALLPAAGPLVVRALDWNADGWQDVTNCQSAWLNDHDGGFAAPIVIGAAQADRCVTGDLDGDGADELVQHVDDELLIHRWTPSGGTLVTTVQDVEYVSSLATADLDEDGLHELIWNSYRNDDMSIAFGMGSGAFLPAGPPRERVGGIGQIHAEDVDGDGHIDIVARGESTILYFPGRGDGTFGPERAWVARGAIAITDFDDDGNPDLIGTDYHYLDGELWVLRGTAP